VTEIVKKKPRCSGPVSREPAQPDATDAGRRSPEPGAAAILRTAANGNSGRQVPPVPVDHDSVPIPASALARDLAERRLRLVWAPAVVLADEPSKIASEGAPASSETIADDVLALMRSARRELVVVSPYFVPGRPMMDLFRELRARGVRVKVLTNSLAATDAPVVHIGYARYRQPLLELGVELHELRRDPGPRRSGLLGSHGSSQASLHAKALVVDGRTLLVGSMNMDPRSALLNTEIGLVLRSPVISEQFLRVYEEVTRSSAYRVELLEGDQLRWASGIPDVPSAAGGEPGAGVGLRLLLLLLAPFAPDEML
jgi:phosphatidylserine/phosphatidylglycerophosphate/cardiolipin synthase-like enzyme